MKRCPACDEPLFRRLFDDLELDGCRGCGGVWFDRGELTTAARAHPEALREADGFFRSGMQPSLDPKRTDVCPGCAELLTEGEHPSFAGIAMRMCAGCGGVFLPNGCGAALAGRLAPGGEPRDGGAVVPGYGAPAAPTAPALAADAPAPVDPTSTAHLPLVRGALVDRDAVHDTGFFASVSRAIRFMGSAVRLARSEPRLMVPTGIGLGLNLVVGALVVAVILLMMPVGGGSATSRAFEEHGVLLSVLLFALAFVGHLASWATMGMTVSAVDGYMKGLPIDLRVAARDVLKNAGGIIVLAIVSMIVDSITSSMRRRNRGLFGVFMRMAAGAIETAWTALSFLLLPVIMIEDIGLFPALSRVREIHRKNLLTIGAGEVGIRIVAAIAGLLVGGLFFGLFSLFRPESPIAVGAFVVFVVLVVLLFNAAFAFLRATYYTCLYLWAIAAETSPAGAQLEVPGPLAEAFS